MKKIISIALICTLALSILSACSGGNSGSQITTETTATSKVSETIDIEPMPPETMAETVIASEGITNEAMVMDPNFTGTVSLIKETYVTVSVSTYNEGSDLGESVRINLSEEFPYKVGDVITVFYNKATRSLPAQVSSVRIEAFDNAESTGEVNPTIPETTAIETTPTVDIYSEFFNGTVAEIFTGNEKFYSYNITPDEDSWVSSSGDLVSISLPKNDSFIFELGEVITIEFDGMVMESYPLQINIFSVNGVPVVYETVEPTEPIDPNSIVAYDVDSGTTTIIPIDEIGSNSNSNSEQSSQAYDPNK